MKRYLWILAATVLLMTSCFGGTESGLTEDGEGKPVVTVDFPPSVEAGSEQVATLTIQNPGPGDMGSVQVTFAALGASDLPDSLVGFGAEGENPSVLEVDPEPTSVSSDAVAYAFGPLEEGESMTIEFRLQMPSISGRYANSVTASDGADPERARGVPLETRVEG